MNLVVLVPAFNRFATLDTKDVLLYDGVVRYRLVELGAFVTKQEVTALTPEAEAVLGELK